MKRGDDEGGAKFGRLTPVNCAKCSVTMSYAMREPAHAGRVQPISFSGTIYQGTQIATIKNAMTTPAMAMDRLVADRLLAEECGTPSGLED